MVRHRHTRGIIGALGICAVLLSAGASQVLATTAIFYTPDGFFPSVGNPNYGNVVEFFGNPDGSNVIEALKVPPSGSFAFAYIKVFTSYGPNSVLCVAQGQAVDNVTGTSGPCIMVFQSNNLPSGTTWGPATGTVSAFDLATGRLILTQTRSGQGYITP